MDGITEVATAKLLEYGLLGVLLLAAVAFILYQMRNQSKERQAHLDDVKTANGVITSLDLQMKMVDLNLRNITDDIREVKESIRDLGRKS